MKHARLSFLVLVGVPLALALAGCGGSNSSSKTVPPDAVAVVSQIQITRDDFDKMLAENKAQMKAQKQTIPKPGTPEYAALRARILDFLVQRSEFEARGKAELGIEISDKQIQDRLKKIKKQYFGGSEKKYLAQIKKQGLTDEQVREDVKSQLLSEAIFAKVTSNVTVSDAAVEKYYRSHLASYKQPAKRQVRHILVKNKALALQIEQQLKNGGDFAALAKKYTTDTSSKPFGGKLPGGITRGQTVAPFDKAAFALKTNEISAPVHTQYGWHIIQPLSKVTPPSTTPLKQVKAAIQQQLAQQKKNDAMTRWVDETKKQYASKIKYAAGFGPATTAAATTG